MLDIQLRHVELAGALTNAAYNAMLHKCDEIEVDDILNQSQGQTESSWVIRLKTTTLLVEAIASRGNGFVRPDNIK